MLHRRAQEVQVTDKKLIVALKDDRTISVPLTWFLRLLHGTPEERTNRHFIGNGEGIHWPDLDEDIEVAHLLAGIPPQESQHALQHWLQQRRKHTTSRQDKA